MKKTLFEPVLPQINFPELEEKILKYWKENKIFERSVEERPKDKPWTFLDGPPFVTGMPHYGSLLPRIAKDVFPRYWTMKGYRVRRVWGWDGHGLPVENKVETKLKIKRKKDIEEKVGIKKFIEECLKYVEETSSEWEWYVDHIGEWIDFKHAYKTWDTPYMESVMWVFKQIYDKGYIYKGLRVSLFCPHCSTPISNFEVAMDAENYKEITEPTAVYKYQLVDDPKTYLLAWSTTPWNKLATPALAVNPKLTYIKVEQGGDMYILAESTKQILKQDYKVVEKITGKDLVGKKFVPHYDFYTIDKGKNAFVVVPGDFVTSDEGTGVVTIAAYGEEDLAVMQKENIHIEMHVDDEGKLKSYVPKWSGQFYLDVDPLVIDDLTGRNLIYRVDQYTHTVPTCWRCHTRLFYGPQNAWYVNVQDLKVQMAKTNEEVNWFPDHFKHGRFLKSLQAAPDWCISRSRYWGSPVPVWECEKCADRFVPGSISELEIWSGTKISTLHKPDIDDVTGTCKKCGSISRRVPEVLDSWIEAGSASFAERHFPFEPNTKLEEFFPPDFIVEYTGQIRAWFYVLHVITNAIYTSKAFKNAVVTGVIAGTDGRKMSKNFGNYPDPKEMLLKYGGDALRLYLLSTPVMHGEDMRISEEDYRQQVRGMMLILWNVYNFFVAYSNVDGFTPKKDTTVSENVLDKWILSLLQKLIADVTASLESYDTVKVVGLFHTYVSDLSTWYIRRSRDRVGPSAEDIQDKHNFYQTSYVVLTTLSQLLAPIAPFMSEEIYRNLTGEDSVHLTSWPQVNKDLLHDELEKNMILARKVVELVHAKRKEAKIKVRQPLAKAKATITGWTGMQNLVQVIQDELNVKKVDIHDGEELLVELDTEIGPQLKAEGEARELVREIQMLRKEKKYTIDQKITVQLPDGFTLDDTLIAYIKKETLATDVVWGKSLEISTGSTSPS